MTKDEVLKLMAKAIEDGWSFDRIDAEVYPAIKEALAQPEQEPVTLPEKIYEFVPTPEPVKWHHPECEGQCIACLIEQVVQEAYGSQGLGYLQRHLTTPPHRKPLSDEEVQKCHETTGHYQTLRPQDRFAVFALARAIEAAHGIKENT